MRYSYAGEGLRKKKLKTLLTADWWAVPVPSLEACRIHKAAGPLTEQEKRAYSEEPPEVQGNSRVRLLDLPGPCSGGFGSHNVFLVAKANSGISLTSVAFDFQSRIDKANSFEVGSLGADTIAVYGALGHDGTTIYSTATAYKVAPNTGKAEPFNLFLTESGKSDTITSLEPVELGEDTEITPFDPSRILHQGRLSDRFEIYDSKICLDEDKGCEPLERKAFTWNGKVFVIDRIEALKRSK